MLKLLSQAPEGVPISAFKADLSGLEIVVRYLKDKQKTPIKEIAEILNRKPSTIYNTYRNAVKKFPCALDLTDCSVLIPVAIISNRTFSVLESIVAYLKDTAGLSFSEIAERLHRSSSTVRTVYRRYQAKK